MCSVISTSIIQNMQEKAELVEKGLQLLEIFNWNSRTTISK